MNAIVHKFMGDKLEKPHSYDVSWHHFMAAFFKFRDMYPLEAEMIGQEILTGGHNLYITAFPLLVEAIKQKAWAYIQQQNGN